MNQPYVKQFDTNGICINPLTDRFTITGGYPNRKQRNNKPIKFKGNHKGISLSVTPTGLYFRIYQFIKTKSGIKTIEHYVLKK
jgi:hypothetical protein